MQQWEINILSQMFPNNKFDSFNRLNYKELFEQINNNQIQTQDQIKQSYQKLDIAIELSLIYEQNVTKQSYNLLFQLNKIYENTEEQYQISDYIIFNALAFSKFWPKLQNTQQAKYKTLKSLVLWFNQFENNYYDSILDADYPVHKTQTQKKILLKKKFNTEANQDFLQAIRAKNYQLIESLLENQQDLIDTIDVDDNQVKACHIACQMGDLTICKILDKFNQNWESLDYEEQTPIFYANQSQNLDLIKFLIFDKKIDYNKKDSQSRTPFYQACTYKSPNILEFLITLENIEINHQSKLQRTGLSKSCYLGRIQSLKLLLSLPHIQIDIPDNKGRTELHNAAWGSKGGKQGKSKKGVILYDCPEAAELLIQHGADINHQDHEGNTPLHIAISSEGLGTMKVLIKHNAIINQKNFDGDTPFYSCCKYGVIKSLELLLSIEGVDIDSPNNKGITPFKRLVLGGFYEQFKLFLDFKMKKQQINFKDEFLFVLNQCIENNTVSIDFLEYYLERLEFYGIEPQYDEDLVKIIVKFNEYKEIKLFKQYLINWISKMPNNIKESLISNAIQHINKGLLNFYLKECKHLLENSEIQDLQLFENDTKNDDFFTFCIQNLQIDIYNLIDKKKENIFHKLIQSRKVSTLTSLINTIMSKDSIQINKYLTFDQNNLTSLLKQKNNGQLTPIDMATLFKYRDIYTIMDNFSKQITVSEQFFQSFKIANYEIITLQQESYFYNQKSLLNQINEKSSQHYIIDENHPIYEKLNQQQSINPDLKKFHYIETQQDLQDMAKDILKYQLNTENKKAQQIIGVDIEYHTDPKINLIQFSCTVQISTVDKDYIIDSMKLRNEIKCELKQIFENPLIIKVLHGSDSDLKLLKSDFDFDIVNLFDTAKAQMILDNNKSADSLANLSKKYLFYKMNKGFQTSDWRIRPLPPAMLEYARIDSQILLYLFPKLLNNLIDNRLLTTFIEQSNKMCVKNIEKCNIKRIDLKFIN